MYDSYIRNYCSRKKNESRFGKTGMLSNAAIFMSYGDTVVMINANASKEPREGIDFSH